ncbi:hypothetical protein B0T16DRAFT_490668, partial [Cercophora newfieldiana]
AISTVTALLFFFTVSFHCAARVFCQRISCQVPVRYRVHPRIPSKGDLRSRYTSCHDGFVGFTPSAAALLANESLGRQLACQQPALGVCPSGFRVPPTWSLSRT